eukprot:Sspe_Gene.24765::Locus_9857_Transcript_1_1_Confidence_1.000_Length_1665::g.24765::m.24765
MPRLVSVAVDRWWPLTGAKRHPQVLPERFRVPAAQRFAGHVGGRCGWATSAQLYAPFDHEVGEGEAPSREAVISAIRQAIEGGDGVVVVHLVCPEGDTPHSVQLAHHDELCVADLEAVATSSADTTVLLIIDISPKAFAASNTPPTCCILGRGIKVGVQAWGRAAFSSAVAAEIIHQLPNPTDVTVSRALSHAWPTATAHIDSVGHTSLVGQSPRVGRVHPDPELHKAWERVDRAVATVEVFLPIHVASPLQADQPSIADLHKAAANRRKLPCGVTGEGHKEVVRFVAKVRSAVAALGGKDVALAGVTPLRRCRIELDEYSHVQLCLSGVRSSHYRELGDCTSTSHKGKGYQNVLLTSKAVYTDSTSPAESRRCLVEFLLTMRPRRHPQHPQHADREPFLPSLIPADLLDAALPSLRLPTNFQWKVFQRVLLSLHLPFSHLPLLERAVDEGCIAVPTISDIALSYGYPVPATLLRCSMHSCSRPRCEMLPIPGGIYECSPRWPCVPMVKCSRHPWHPERALTDLIPDAEP